MRQLLNLYKGALKSFAFTVIVFSCLWFLGISPKSVSFSPAWLSLILFIIAISRELRLGRLLSWSLVAAVIVGPIYFHGLSSFWNQVLVFAFSATITLSIVAGFFLVVRRWENSIPSRVIVSVNRIDWYRQHLKPLYYTLCGLLLTTVGIAFSYKEWWSSVTRASERP